MVIPLTLCILMLRFLYFSNSFPSYGLEIKNFPENSILFEIFKENKESKFYLIEFNGIKTPEPSSLTGNLNFKIVLKDLYNFCQNPKKMVILNLQF